MENRLHGPGASQCDEDCGIAHVSASGLITPTSLAGVLRHAAEFADERSVGAMVARYDASALMMDPAQMLATARHFISAGSGLAMPVALVVQPDQLEHFQTYAGLMAQQGIVRMAFTSHACALAWAQGEAALYESARRRAAVVMRQTLAAARAAPVRRPAPSRHREAIRTAEPGEGLAG